MLTHRGGLRWVEDLGAYSSFNLKRQTGRHPSIEDRSLEYAVLPQPQKLSFTEAYLNCSWMQVCAKSVLTVFESSATVNGFVFGHNWEEPWIGREGDHSLGFVTVEFPRRFKYLRRSLSTASASSLRSFYMRTTDLYAVANRFQRLDQRVENQKTLFKTLLS
jgi:hypothetical protein